MVFHCQSLLATITNLLTTHPNSLLLPLDAPSSTQESCGWMAQPMASPSTSLLCCRSHWEDYAPAEIAPYSICIYVQNMPEINYSCYNTVQTPALCIHDTLDMLFFFLPTLFIAHLMLDSYGQPRSLIWYHSTSPMPMSLFSIWCHHYTYFVLTVIH